MHSTCATNADALAALGFKVGDTIKADNAGNTCPWRVTAIKDGEVEGLAIPAKGDYMPFPWHYVPKEWDKKIRAGKSFALTATTERWFTELSPIS